MGFRKKLTLMIVVFLYLVTWVGGWFQHSHDLANESWTRYRLAEKYNAKLSDYAKEAKDEVHLIQLREGGPAVRVNWCFPILPGILLANSDSVIGPLSGYGGPKIVVYYGFGSTELFWFGWIS